MTNADANRAWLFAVVDVEGRPPTDSESAVDFPLPLVIPCGFRTGAMRLARASPIGR